MSIHPQSLLQMIEAASIASVVAWVFAVLTWRRILAHRALAFLLSSVVLLIVLGAPLRETAPAAVCALVIAFLELVQRHRGSTSK
jgi:hypothetical protein